MLAVSDLSGGVIKFIEVKVWFSLYGIAKLFDRE
jgi:hypothetical protein